ncbi:MAG: aminoacyl-histidine dipeptidase [Bacillota bacterium]|nr:aminoacyl-histidine dipeptidase [Bacillota bacterium]
MDGVLAGLKPESVFGYFEEISRIPRGTGNEKGISDYLTAFAGKHGLEVIQDKVNNVIIKKPATPGYEKAPAIILQGHMDMVCEKNKGTVHDFLKDPIKLRIDGDMVYADNTTLGADNGTAVAYMMAILSSTEIRHPRIEALFTASEEGSMAGAFNFDPECLSGRLLINLDSEREGCLTVSSAGGMGAKFIIDAEYEEAPADFEAYRISIGGLKGGHSGGDITKGRANANKLLGRVLYGLCEKTPFLLKSADGGLKANAITRESEAVIFAAHSRESILKENAGYFEQLFKREYGETDGGVFVKTEKIPGAEHKALSDAVKNRLIKSLMLLPYGVQSMSMKIEDLVESSNNPGVMKTGENGITIDNAIRSCEKSRKYYIANQIKCIADALGCRLAIGSDYPEWAYNENSKLRKHLERVFTEMYGRKPLVKAIHAGLECGILAERLPGVDITAIGPDVFDEHTPHEHMSISSVRSTYLYLLKVLEEAGDI